MNAQLAKAMFEMWAKTTLKPLVEGAMRSAIPAELIAGALIGAAVQVARTAGWKRAQVAELLEAHWTEVAQKPPG